MQLSSGLPGVARNQSTFGLSDRLLGTPCHVRAMYAQRSDLSSDLPTKKGQATVPDQGGAASAKTQRQEKSL
jgi:hypothetical protein